MGILHAVQNHSFQCYCHYSLPVSKYASLFPSETRLCQRARAQGMRTGDLPRVYTVLHRVAHCDTAAAVAAKAACTPNFGRGRLGRGFGGGSERGRVASTSPLRGPRDTREDQRGAKKTNKRCTSHL